MFVQSMLIKNLAIKNSLSFLMTCCIFLASTSSAFAADIAGRVIMARGDVTAINENGAMRNLQRRDSIFNHEIIKTGDNSKVQIRFTDNALLALKANSELNIKSYAFSEDSSQHSPKNSTLDNKVILELVTGGFRTLTGKIGKGNKEAYQVNTPAASIGIRGTLYEIQVSTKGLLAAVWKGGIFITTQQGQFDLGINADFDFAEISAEGEFSGSLTPADAFAPPISSTGLSLTHENNVNTLDLTIPGPFEKEKDAFSVEIIRNTILQQNQDGQLILTDDLKEQFEKEPYLFYEMLEILELEEGSLNNPPVFDDYLPGINTPDTSTPDTNIPDPNASDLIDIPTTTTP